MDQHTLEIRQELAQRVLTVTPPEELIRTSVRVIHDDVLTRSRHVSDADFKAIHPRDLEFLFESYDRLFFENLCRPSLGGSRLDFRLSTRMTKAGGKTARMTSRVGDVSYEIAIGVGMLFDGFNGSDRTVTVCGLECGNRLEALQRIFEHEVVHLIEQLCWNNSDCSAAQFHGIAARFFRHQAHTHDLVTRRERAARAGIRVGSLVAFTYEGQKLAGRVNRITKRATVLVEHPDGAAYSDGRKYKTFYVPITSLEALSGS